MNISNIQLRARNVFFFFSLFVGAHVSAKDYYFGPSRSFLLEAQQQARALGFSLGTIESPDGGGVYWRGFASDATYMRFDLSSLASAVIKGDVNLDLTVDSSYGGQINSGKLSQANGSWSAPGMAPGFTVISNTTSPNDSFSHGDKATWTINASEFASLMGSSTFHGLVVTAEIGSTAHFSGKATLSGNTTTPELIVSGGEDWTAGAWVDSSKTLVVSAPVSGGNVTLKPGVRLFVSDAANLSGGQFTGSFVNQGILEYSSSSPQVFSGSITGTGSLIKSGTGTLTLSGTNTHTGTNIVTGGMLVASSAGAVCGTDLHIAAGSRVSLNFTGQARVPQLLLNGVAQAEGTYGSTSSPASNKNDAFFSGTGVILVSSQTPAQAYAVAMQAWSAGDWTAVRSALDWVVSDDRLPAKNRSISQLLIARSYQAQGNYVAASAAYAAVAANNSYPQIHRMEGEECAAEMNRLAQGLPARDPEASRIRLTPAPTPGRVLHVAPNGNDSNSGTLAQPFATVNAALAANRAAGPAPSGTLILLADGFYPVTSTISLSSADSGTASAPLSIRAANSGKAVFYGGKRLSGFQTVTDAGILARLPEEARGRVMQCSLSSLGITDYGSIQRFGGFGTPFYPMVNLYVNGAPQTLARWPNSGFVRVGGIVDAGFRDWTGQAPDRPQTFSYLGDRPSRWTTATDGWLHGYFSGSAYDGSVGIGSVNPTAKTITTATLVNHYTGWPEMNAQSTFRVFNLLEEIDQAGEWYLDRSSGMLYWYPSADPATATIDLSMISAPMLTASSTSNVRIEGIVFDCSRGDGLKIINSSDCIVAGCTVRNLSGVAVAIEGGQRNKMIGCDLHNLDQVACKLIGGDRETLEPGNHVIANSRFRGFGRVLRGGGIGVIMDGVAHTISHCEFEDCPNTAITFGGPKHLVEFNSFRNCGNETDDSGVVASWGNPTFWGNIWRFNRFSHCGGGQTQGWVQHRRYGMCMFKFDDAISGQTVYGNIIDHADQWGEMCGAFGVNSGRDNFFDNNVVISAFAYQAGYYAQGNHRYQWYTDSGSSPSSLNQAYLTAFPELANLYDGKGQNYAWRGIAFDLQSSFPANDPNAWGSWNLMGNTPLGSDPGFLDGSELKASIPASIFQSYGLRAIPVEEIGLYNDSTRAGWIDNPGLLHWNGGSGTWNTTDSGWAADSSSSASQIWNNNGQISAVFSGEGGTVTTGGFVRTKGIKFANTGYTLGGTFTITLEAQDTVIDASNGATISAPLIGIGGIAVSSGGTLTLSGVNSYNGTTAVRSGTLALSGGHNRLPVGTNLNLGDAGLSNSGILQLNGCNQELAGIWTVGSQNYHWGYFAGNRVINGSPTPCTLKLNIQNGYNQFVGTLGGPGQYDSHFAVTKTGPGTLMLGRSANWTGGTTIEQGTLELRSNFYQGNSASGIFRIGRNATFAVSGVADTLSFNGVTVEFLPEGGGTFTNLGGSDWLNLQVNSGMTLRTRGGLRNRFSTAPNYSLNLNSQNLLLDVARGTDADSDLEVSMPLNNGGALTKQGSGIVTLTAACSWSGATTIHGGTLSVSSESLGSGAVTINSGGTLLVSEGWAFGGNSPYGTNGETIPSVTVNSGGVLHFNPSNGHLAGITDLDLNGGSVTGGGGYFEANFGTLFLANGNEQITAGGATTSTITASIGLYGDNNLITVDNGSTLNISGPVRNSHWWGSSDSGGFIKAGNGTLVLSGANTYSGITAIQSGKVILTGNSNATASVNISNGSSLEISGNLSVSGNVTNQGMLLFTGASQFSAGGIITNYGTIINSSPSMVLPSNIVNFGTIVQLPAAPQGLVATPGNGQVSLTWLAVSGATSYEVLISATPGGPYTAATSVTAPNATITGLTNGATSYFVVRSINAAGQSASSNELFATPEGGLPLPYLTTDIGTVGIAGSASHNAGVFTLQGAGAGVFAVNDSFRFVYQNSSGDCSITARVQSLTNTSVSAKTGVMIRESLAANTRCAGVYLTPSSGVQFIWRTSTGTMASVSSVGNVSAPCWIRLTRTGNIFKAFYSSNGTKWTQFGGNRTISMVANSVIGMASTSGTTQSLSTGSLLGVNVVP